MQRTSHIRIKLLVTLVLFTLAVASDWMVSSADARGLPGPGASSHFVSTRPGALPHAGDPDTGQPVSTPPPPGMKGAESVSGEGPSLANWVQWASRIWATLMLRYAR